MITKFKKGDRVKLLTLGRVHRDMLIPVGAIGTVLEDDYTPDIAWDGFGSVCAHEDRLELVAPSAPVPATFDVDKEEVFELLSGHFSKKLGITFKMSGISTFLDKALLSGEVTPA